MTPSSKYNGYATTTKAIKLQRNTRAPAASLLSPTASVLTSSTTSFASSSSSAAASSRNFSSTTAALLLTSYMNSSSLFHDEEDEQTTLLLPTAVDIASLGSSNKNNDDNINNNSKQVSRTMPSFKIISYQNMIALLTVLVCGLATVNGLKCYMCGQYNEGVGSITPCTNYSDQYAHLYLKECSKKSEKYCVKYVSELSTVRDCATECAEKEIWETQTYCCTEDGCNGSASIEATTMVIMLPVIAYLGNAIWNVIKGRR